MRASKKRVNVLRDFIHSKEQEMLQLLKQLVNIDSGSNCKQGIDNIGTLLKERFERLGFYAEIIEEKKHGNHLVIRHCQVDDPKIIIIGHMDTVFPKGTAEKRPFQIKGQRAFGPGVIDMKASIVQLIYALTCMKETGQKEYQNVQIILNSDEELGSPTSRELIMRQAKNKRYALVLESARPDGSIVSARRGVGQFKISVEGKAAHSGIEPEKGSSAIEELAYKVIKLQQLTNDKEGIHVNVGMISGGTAVNTVPAFATAKVDVRISKKEQMELVQKNIEKICSTIFVYGTKTSLVGKIDHVPMEKNEQTEQLLKMIQQAGDEIGLTIMDTATGGSSDGSFTSAVGIPTIDGMGPVGGHFHSEEEYLDIPSLFERTLLLAKVIQKIY